MRKIANGDGKSAVATRHGRGRNEPKIQTVSQFGGDKQTVCLAQHPEDVVKTKTHNNFRRLFLYNS